MMFSSFFLTSCAPESNNLPKITVSRDTVIFDTIFTSIGSMTKIFLIRNNSDETVNLDRVYIPSGNTGPYQFNVNGYTGPSVTDLELEAHDSIYVFVEVTLDPNGGTNPLIVEDSIVVEYNNHANYARAMLVAFGQDAIYYYPDTTLINGLQISHLPCNTTWGPGKPIVVVGYLVVDSACMLTILPGTQVHFYSNGALYADQYSTLQVLGDAHNPVTFQGTKLEFAYKDVPGQWDRIYVLEGSTNNIIRNAVIRNGFIGLQLDNFNAWYNGDLSKPKHIQLENVKIQNMSAVGIFSRHYNVDAYNVLVSNCGQYCAAFTMGGNIKFYQSTLANYWSGGIRNFPSLFFNNYFYDGVSTITPAPLNLEFNNGIVYGNNLGEIDFDSTGGASFTYQINNSLLKIDNNFKTPALHFNAANVYNQEPDFTDDFHGIYTLGNTSAAIDIGDPTYVGMFSDKLMFDLNGSNRLTSGNPDAGAFER
jgi:hypothetical protein